MNDKSTGGNRGVIRRFFEIRNILFSALIILFFVSIILFYYRSLYLETRDNIIKNGRMSAMRTANQVGDYLDSSIEAVMLTSYTIEKMIDDGDSIDDIVNYMTGQTTAITSTIFENTTGMYGYVNDTYIDGSGWVPEEGYEPKTRPWYINAIEYKGEIALVDPYLDVQTKTIMMSIAKMLSDGSSVVSMDITLDKIQSITEEVVANGDSDYEVILDSSNMAVAHSDRSEVGKTYEDDDASFWGRIISLAHNPEDEYYEFDYGGERYIVYSMVLRSGWHCLTIKNATSTFRPLKVLLAVTISLVIVVVLVLTYILYNSLRRFMVADRLNKQLSSIADTFYVLFDIDIMNNDFSVIKSSVDIKTEGPDKYVADARVMLPKVTRIITSDISWPEIEKFMDFGTLNERLRKQDTVAEEFLSINNIWCRARFVVSRRNPDGTLNHVLWIVEGIHEEKSRREQLIEMSEKALAESRAKSAFLSNMSHEIRTPINGVLGMNEMILRESNESNIIEYSQSIKTSGNTLLSLINDILDFSKIESGKMEIVPVDYDLSSVVNDLVNMIQPRAMAKGLELILEIDSDMPKLLNGDEVRVKQVITNILTNAVKYTDKGSVTFSISYSDTDDDSGDILITFVVKDTGIGIKSENIDKLFKEYERIDVARNRNIEGTGLGLSITKSLLEMMGSTIEVDSVYGLGSKFGFTLRQKVRKREPIGDYVESYEALLKEHKKYEEKLYATDARILMVDDNRVNITVFKQLLKKTGIQIDSALNGDECIELCRENKYDMIFLDHMMPGKDGIETLHELKADENCINTDSVVVCLTANAISGAREQYLAEGFDDYLTKPISPDDLEKQLMTYIPGEKIKQTPEEEET